MSRSSSSSPIDMRIDAGPSEVRSSYKNKKNIILSVDINSDHLQMVRDRFIPPPPATMESSLPPPLQEVCLLICYVIIIICPVV